MVMSTSDQMVILSQDYSQDQGVAKMYVSRVIVWYG